MRDIQERFCAFGRQERPITLQDRGLGIHAWPSHVGYPTPVHKRASNVALVVLCDKDQKLPVIGSEDLPKLRHIDLGVVKKIQKQTVKAGMGLIDLVQ